MSLSYVNQLQSWMIVHGNATITINPANPNTELNTSPRYRTHVDLRLYTYMRVRSYISALTGIVSIKVRHSPSNSMVLANIFDLGVSVSATSGQWVESNWILIPSIYRIETWIVPAVDGVGGSVGLTSYHVDVTNNP